MECPSPRRADGHYYETEDAFLRHMPAKSRKEFRHMQVNGRTKIAIGGHISEIRPDAWARVQFLAGRPPKIKVGRWSNCREA